MKLASLPLLFFVLCALASADLKKLDGTWKPVSGEMGGGKLPKALLDKMVLILKNGAYDYDEGHGHDIGKMKETGTKPPLAVDIVGTEGPNKGRIFKAIYQYDGKTLTICYGSDAVRPASFDPKGKGVILVVKYRRG
jgi:uncharacterized protein (TIGR03067 family)